jgi:hypothetical protein
MRILFISANPHWEARLDLAEELRLLMRAIKGRDVDLMLLPAAQPVEVEAALEYEHPDIVHFSGHATDKSGILLRNSDGETEELRPERLRKLFAPKDGKKVQLVVLNACNTKACLEELKDSVGAGIATTELLGDGAGKIFTKYFYKALAAGDAIKEAYGKALESIRLAELNNVYVDSFDTGDGAECMPFKGVGKSDRDHVTPEVLRGWETYFYLSFLDEQIESLRHWIRRNRIEFGILVALAIVFAGILFWRATGSGDIVRSLAQVKQDMIGEQPLLPWLLSGGGAVPAIYSFLQERLVAHGNERLHGLKSLRDLVNASEELTDDIRATLHRLLDQTLRGAQSQ